MTLAAETQIQDYACNGVTDDFAIPFKWYEQSDIKVIKKTVATGAESALTLNVDYTITGGTLDDNTQQYTGGNVHFAAAPASTFEIWVYRKVSEIQDYDYNTTGPFPASSHEAALDKLTAMIQHFRFLFSRALLFKKTSDFSDVEFPELEASTVIVVNDDGDGLECAPSSDLGLYTSAYQNGSASIANGATSKSITFATPFASTSYAVNANILNTTDATPQAQPLVITAKATTGFTVSWPDATDSANYVLEYLAMEIV
jgi:hypothetical protein